MTTPGDRSSSKTVVIVYEMVPEETRVFKLTVSPEDFEKIVACHERYTNADGVEELFLDDYLTDKKPVPSKEPLDIRDADTLVVSGFIL